MLLALIKNGEYAYKTLVTYYTIHLKCCAMFKGFVRLSSLFLQRLRDIQKFEKYYSLASLLILQILVWRHLQG